MSARVFIATPTTGGIVKAAFSQARCAMVATLERAGIQTEIGQYDGIGIAQQRDVLAAFALRTRCTHILFIDSDMDPPPDLAAKFISAKKPMVGAACVKRRLDLEKLEAAIKNGLPLQSAIAKASDFTIRLTDSTITGSGDFCRVHGIGMGFTMIERGVFETMQKKLPLHQFASRHVVGKVTGFFEERNAPDGTPLSEDFSFCQRWLDCGGEVWADIQAVVRHVGDFPYAASFARWMESHQIRPLDADTAVLGGRQ